MKRLHYVRPSTLQEAADLAGERGSMLLGGGTDLVPRLKAWLVPDREGDRLVSLRDVSDLGEIRKDSDGSLHVGAGVTLAELVASPLIQSAVPLLHDASSSAATPQLRNVATVGGNLMQRSRCPYYRTPDSFEDCLLKGGQDCPARQGESQHAGIFGEGVCRSAHPSDLAPVLLALDARLLIQAPRETREMALEELFAEPDTSCRRETRLGAGEVIAGVRIPSERQCGPPADSGGPFQRFEKGMERATWSFALASVAISTRERFGGVRIWLGAVASIPWRASGCEAVLEGADPGRLPVEEAVAAVAENAQPLAGNRYKIRLLEGLLRQALTRSS